MSWLHFNVSVNICWLHFIFTHKIKEVNLLLFPAFTNKEFEEERTDINEKDKEAKEDQKTVKEEEKPVKAKEEEKYDQEISTATNDENEEAPCEPLQEKVNFLFTIMSIE